MGCGAALHPATPANHPACRDRGRGDCYHGRMVVPPTLRDVARVCGYSTATVSMALRDNPRIPEATRGVIRAAADKLGYRSEPMLAALAAHRWNRRPRSGVGTLAALADGVLEGRGGMSERAHAYGYGFEVFSIRDYSDPARLSHVLFSRGIVGLIVGQIFTPGFCAAFDWSRFVSVACSEGFERPPVHLIMPNHFRAVQECWDRAWQAGYRRIGLAIFDMPAAIDMHDRHAAFLERQQLLPASQRLPVLSVKPWGQDPDAHAAGIAATAAWLRRHRPEVVLGFNGVFRWVLAEAGARVPEDVAFISLWITTPDTAARGLRLHVDDVGRRAVEWLDALLRAGERGLPPHPATMLIDMVWQDGPGA